MLGWNLNVSLVSNWFVFSYSSMLSISPGWHHKTEHTFTVNFEESFQNHHRLPRHSSENQTSFLWPCQAGRGRVEIKQTAKRHFTVFAQLYSWFFFQLSIHEAQTEWWALQRGHGANFCSEWNTRAVSRALRSLHAITQINQLHSVLANGTVAVAASDGETSRLSLYLSTSLSHTRTRTHTYFSFY